MAEKILLVDDDVTLLKGLQFSLEQQGYEVLSVTNGMEALDIATKEEFDAIILDIAMPEFSGLEFCKKIRETSDIPIIMLSAKSDELSRVLGLEYGADDYVTKPFNTLELKARIKAIFRRTRIPDSQKHSNIMNIGDFQINTLGRKVNINNKQINLTAKEFDLLLLLILNEDKVFTREELLETIWGYEYFGDVRTVDVHIRRLREKIEINSSQPEYIQTKWGVGYFFRQEPQK